MKIMFLLRFFPEYGGGEMVTIKLANEFVKMGYYVNIAFLWTTDCKKIIEINSNIKLIKIINNSQPKGKEDIKRNELKIIQSSLESIIRSEIPQIIINQWLPPKMVFKANNNKAKIVSCRHASIYINSFKWNLVSRILKNKFKYLLRMYYWDYYKYSSKWVLLCKKFENEAKDLFDQDKLNKIISIYNPCRYDSYFNMREYMQKENNVLYVGRIYKEKRVDLLVDVWKALEIFVVKYNWKLYIVGSGNQLDYLKKKTASLNCKNISFEGQKEPLEYYRKSKIFASTSETEGYPMTLIEAMRNGCVPIAMNTYSSISDVIESGCGVIVEDDFDCYKEELLKMMIHEAQLKAMSKASIYSSRRFDINKILAEWKDMFDLLMNDNKVW